MKSAVVAIVIVVGLMAGCAFGGYYYGESKHAKKLTALNAKIYKQGVALQTSTNKQAELNRQIKTANKERIDAIKTNEHASKTVKHLQSVLDSTAAKLAVANRHIVISVDAVARVYMDARNECHGLADTNDPPIISAKLSEFTGDSITGVIKHLVGSRCEIAIDYNNLYADSEKLLAKKSPN